MQDTNTAHFRTSEYQTTVYNQIDHGRLWANCKQQLDLLAEMLVMSLLFERTKQIVIPSNINWTNCIQW